MGRGNGKHVAKMNRVGREGAVGSIKIREPRSGVVDLKLKWVFVSKHGKYVIPFNFWRHICVFQNPLFLKKAGNMIMDENSLIKTIKQANIISTQQDLVADTAMFLDSEPEVTISKVSTSRRRVLSDEF